MTAKPVLQGLQNQRVSTDVHIAGIAPEANGQRPERLWRGVRFGSMTTRIDAVCTGKAHQDAPAWL
jgi:hypothetical protein